jgi:hypothetical protein
MSAARKSNRDESCLEWEKRYIELEQQLMRSQHNHLRCSTKLTQAQIALVKARRHIDRSDVVPIAEICAEIDAALASVKEELKIERKAKHETDSNTGGDCRPNDR